MEEELYKITPLEKKSIINKIELYRNNDDGTISWFNIEDHYRWGFGFIEGEELLPLKENDAYCDPRVGDGPDLVDQVACFFEFSDDITLEERKEIENHFFNEGNSWIYDGNHEWEIEDDSIVILPPYSIDKVENLNI